MTRRTIILLIAVVCLMLPRVARANDAEGAKFDPKETIFDHLGDGYGW